MTVRELRLALFDLPQDDEVRIAVPVGLNSVVLGTRGNFVITSLRPELHDKELYGRAYVVHDRMGDLVGGDMCDSPYLTVVPPGTPAIDAREGDR